MSYVTIEMAMQPHSPFDALSDVIERLGSDRRSVRRVEAVAGCDGDESLHAAVDVSIPICATAAGDDASGLEPTSAAIDGDELRVSFQTASFSGESLRREVDSVDGASVSARPTDVRLDGGAAVVTLDVVIGPAAAAEPTAEAPGTLDEARATPLDEAEARPFEDGGADGIDADSTGADSGRGTAAFGSTSVDAGSADERNSAAEGSATGGRSAVDGDASDDVGSELSAVRDGSVPPYEDVPYLRRLYDACETFDEMSERIDMDVSAETVRRYMIDADVHSPTSYGTGEADRSAASSERGRRSSDGPDRSPADEVESPLPDDQLLADGIGLPDDLTLRDVVDAVVDSRTVYEVQQQLGVDQERTRRLLGQLNVLDLVLRRVSNDPERRVSYETVTARIRQSSPEDV